MIAMRRALSVSLVPARLDVSRTFTGRVLQNQWQRSLFQIPISPHRSMTTSFVSGHERHNNKKHDEIHGTTIETSCCVGHAAGDNHSADCKETFLNDFNALLDADETDSLKSSVSPQMNIGNLLENNKRWVQKKTQEDPEFFRRQATLHKPEYLFIGCSDARLSVQHMLGLEMGQLFVHRNVANQVVNTDLNFVTCLTYAVDVLKVKNIIICGHYDCGGVRAAMRNHDHGIIEQWIMGIRDVARYHKNELRDIKDPDLIHRRLVELNVQEQALKLYASPVVQRSQAQHGIPQIHALVFDVGEGYLKELSVDFKKIIKKYKDVYSMYNFADQKNEKST